MKWKLPRIRSKTPSNHKQRKRKSKPEPTTGIRPENFRLFTMGYILCGIILVVDMYALYAHWSNQRVPEVPAVLLGTWTTTAQGYADRALEITETSLIFHTGETGPMAYSIDRVSTTPRERTTSYTVYYGSRRDEQTLAFEYSWAPDIEIRLRNQRHLTWRKQNPN